MSEENFKYMAKKLWDAVIKAMPVVENSILRSKEGSPGWSGK